MGSNGRSDILSADRITRPGPEAMTSDGESETEGDSRIPLKIIYNFDVESKGIENE